MMTQEEGDGKAKENGVGSESQKDKVNDGEGNQEELNSPGKNEKPLSGTGSQLRPGLRKRKSEGVVGP